MLCLAKAGGPRQSTADRPDYERNRALSQKEREGARQDCRYRQKPVYDIEFAGGNARSQLSPCLYFKCYIQWVAKERRERLGVRHEIVFEDAAHNPVEETIKPVKPDDFDGTEHSRFSPEHLLAVRPDDESHVMKASESLGLKIADQGPCNAFGTRVWREDQHP
jgi:hypothetical protein